MSNEIQKFQQKQSLDFFNPSQYEIIKQVSTMFANSELVPDMYRHSDKNTLAKATANCMIALEVAHRIGASPLMVMQNLVIIYGRPSWSSTFLIATVNTCGRFEPLKYKFTNLGKLGKVEFTEYVWAGGRKSPKTSVFDGSHIDNIQCVAYTSAKGSDEVLESAPIDVRMAIEEGWYTKNGSKWPTMTKQMLIYRSASFWTRAYAPELSMGMQTAEEIIDVVDIPYEEVKDKVEAKKANEANKTEINMEDEIKKAEQLGKDEVLPKEEAPKPKAEPKKAEPKKEATKEEEPKEEAKEEPKSEPQQPKGMFDQENGPKKPSWMK